MTDTWIPRYACAGRPPRRAAGRRGMTRPADKGDEGHLACWWNRPDVVRLMNEKITAADCRTTRRE